MKIFNIKILFITVFIFVAGCNTNNLVTNPPPFVEIVKGPADNSVISTEDISFSWKGSTNDYQFRYRLLTLDKDNFPTEYLGWTTYSSLNEVVFKKLNDSKFKFEVQGKSSGIEARPVSRTFTINAFIGPAFTFFKNETIMNVGDTASIGIWMEDIDSLSAATIVTSFDKSSLQVVSVLNGRIAEKNRLSQFILPNYELPSVLLDANSSGKLNISTAVLQGIGSLNKSSVSGSGVLINIVFMSIQKGETTLQITSSDTRKIDGTKINTNPPKDGLVIVQ